MAERRVECGGTLHLPTCEQPTACTTCTPIVIVTYLVAQGEGMQRKDGFVVQLAASEWPPPLTEDGQGIVVWRYVLHPVEAMKRTVQREPLEVERTEIPFTELCSPVKGPRGKLFDPRTAS